MSRVTIHDICKELITILGPKYDEPVAIYDSTISDIEVVPRRIVEKIIEFCVMSCEKSNEPTGNSHIDDFHTGIWAQSLDTKHYAEFLLKQFEEELQKDQFEVGDIAYFRSASTSGDYEKCTVERITNGLCKVKYGEGSKCYSWIPVSALSKDGMEDTND